MFIQILYILLFCYTPPLESNEELTEKKLDINSLIASREDLKQGLEEHYHRETLILIQEFRYKEKTKHLTYLPNIEYNFISFLPSITYSTSKIANSVYQQRAMKSKIRSIQSHMKLVLQNDLEKLHRYYADLEAEVNYYNHAIELYLLKKALINLKVAQYNNLEITPIELMESEIKLKREELKLIQKYTEILKIRNYILEIAKANTKYEK